MNDGKKLTLDVLQGLENQLLNAQASEGKKDILEIIQIELEEVQGALKWIHNIIIKNKELQIELEKNQELVLRSKHVVVLADETVNSGQKYIKELKKEISRLEEKIVYLKKSNQQ